MSSIFFSQPHSSPHIHNNFKNWLYNFRISDKRAASYESKCVSCLLMSASFARHSSLMIGECYQSIGQWDQAFNWFLKADACNSVSPLAAANRHPKHHYQFSYLNSTPVRNRLSAPPEATVKFKIAKLSAAKIPPGTDVERV